MRNNVVKMAPLKHELKAAPAYAYYFTWQTPILDGLPGAWHTADLLGDQPHHVWANVTHQPLHCRHRGKTRCSRMSGTPVWGRVPPANRAMQRHHSRGVWKAEAIRSGAIAVDDQHFDV